MQRLINAVQRLFKDDAKSYKRGAHIKQRRCTDLETSKNDGEKNMPHITNTDQIRFKDDLKTYKRPLTNNQRK